MRASTWLACPLWRSNGVCPKELSLLQKAEVLLGMKQGETPVEKTMANFGTGINGWNVDFLGTPMGD